MKSFKEFVGTKLKIPKGNLGIPRSEMPQIASRFVPQFITYLKKNGASTVTKMESVSTLKMTQDEVNNDKILRMINDAPASVLAKPIIVSKDGFILDGHHRFVALLNKDKSAKLKIFKVDIIMKELLKLAHSFPQVEVKGINEHKGD
ncbi:nuclease [Paraglaciecola Antarctic GD virus 1]|nr:nuclease [Paraglaciecola Antarctic GD virus 1]